MQHAINIDSRSRNARHSLGRDGQDKGGIFAKVAVGSGRDKTVEDTEGVSIGTSLAAQIRLLNRTMHDANTTTPMEKPVQGATIETARALQHITRLAINPANDSVTDSKRLRLNRGVMRLIQEMNRIAEESEWNNPRGKGQ